MNTDNQDLIHINVIVADRPYPLKIKKNEEEYVRKAAKEVNEKVKEFQRIYAGKDKQDFLAMSALMYAVEVVSNESKTVIEDSSFSDKLNELESMLDQSLKR